MLKIDASFLVVFAIVWILAFILKKIFFGPVKAVRDKRQEALERDREAARLALENFDRTVAGLEQSLKTARTQAEAEREALGAAALQEKSRLLGELGAESRRNVDQAKEELGRASAGLKHDMDLEVEAISRKIEERLLS